MPGNRAETSLPCQERGAWSPPWRGQPWAARPPAGPTTTGPWPLSMAPVCNLQRDGALSPGGGEDESGPAGLGRGSRSAGAVATKPSLGHMPRCGPHLDSALPEALQPQSQAAVPAPLLHARLPRPNPKPSHREGPPGPRASLPLAEPQASPLTIGTRKHGQQRVCPRACLQARPPVGTPGTGENQERCR